MFIWFSGLKTHQVFGFVCCRFSLSVVPGGEREQLLAQCEAQLASRGHRSIYLYRYVTFIEFRLYSIFVHDILALSNSIPEVKVCDVHLQWTGKLWMMYFHRLNRVHLFNIVQSLCFHAQSVHPRRGPVEELVLKERQVESQFLLSSWKHWQSATPLWLFQFHCRYIPL